MLSRRPLQLPAGGRSARSNGLQGKRGRKGRRGRVLGWPYPLFTRSLLLGWENFILFFSCFAPLAQFEPGEPAVGAISVENICLQIADLKQNESKGDLNKWRCSSMARYLTYPYVIHADTQLYTHTHIHSSLVIPVGALNYLCHNHSKCCQASQRSKHIWLHYSITHAVAPRWCAPSGRQDVWFHHIFRAPCERGSSHVWPPSESLTYKRHYGESSLLCYWMVCMGSPKYQHFTGRYRWNSHCSRTISDCAKAKLRGRSATYCMWKCLSHFSEQ